MGMNRFLRGWLRRQLERKYSDVTVTWEKPGDAETHVFTRLRTFVPNSANARKYPGLVLSGAERFPEQINGLLGMVGRSEDACPTVTAEVFGGDVDASRLGQLFTQYGSDKGSHGYHRVYARLCAAAGGQPASVLEIGLGTNNTDVISNMGEGGRPGASLRAFRDYLPGALIYGADVDKGILFSEERIETGFVDQLDPATFDALARSFGRREFDLIIDDGLHCPEANLNSLFFALKSLTENGVFVIEDIPDRALAVWNAVGAILNGRGWHAGVVSARKSFMFLATRAPASLFAGLPRLVEGA